MADLQSHPVSPFLVILLPKQISSCCCPKSCTTSANRALKNCTKGHDVLWLSFCCSACISSYTRLKERRLRLRTKARLGYWPTGNRWTTGSSSPPLESFSPSPLLYCKSVCFHSVLLGASFCSSRQFVLHTHCEGFHSLHCIAMSKRQRCWLPVVSAGKESRI